MKILLSIKPEFVKKIFKGEKRFEFRKRIPKKHFEKVIIYESSPTQNIVGWFIVDRVIKGHPDLVWQECKDEGGIGKTRYYLYCNGNNRVYAFRIKEFHKLDKPIDPYEIMPDFIPPQNFAYIDSTCAFSNLLDNAGGLS